MTLNHKDRDYPQKLLKIKNYPDNLYVIGNVSLLNNCKVVAIVGSRNCTEYGRKMARVFAKDLSTAGVCVISGLAQGVDTASHYGALYEKGKTIAVLGGGLNNIYPKENEWLYKEIINNKGCIITEYPEGEQTITSNFPKRNRIISGIADGVLIIEAKSRSGTKITAKYAKEQGKTVFCIPSNLDNANGVGTAELICSGATLVMDANQIIEKLSINQTYKNIEIMEVPEAYREVYIKLKEKPISNNELRRCINNSIGEINSILTMMEIEGYIEQMPGNMFKIKE